MEVPAGTEVVVFGRDGRWLAAASSEATWIWDTRSGSLRTIRRHRGLVSAVLAFSADGRWLAASGFGTTHIWDAHSGEPVRALNHGIFGVGAVAFSADGLWLATATSGEGVVVWDLIAPSRQ